MSGAFTTRLTRWRLNFFPAYRGTGAADHEKRDRRHD